MNGKETLLTIILIVSVLLVLPTISEAKFDSAPGQLLSLDGINPQQIGYMEADLQFTADLLSSAELLEINHSVYILPEEYSDLQVSADYYIVGDEYGNDQLVLHWDNFKSDSYEVTMHIKNRAKTSGAKKVPYPYTLPNSEEFLKYITESNNSKITDEIRAKAKEIVEDSEDSFEVVTRLSHWIYTNIKYDISLGDVIKDSEWIYENGRGTCDEFATLFIAMARAVGIPARYIAGVTYTQGGWGYHGWAEVYLDGWVPVDPTWDEIGWLDATHISFGKFLDSADIVMKSAYKTYSSTTLTMEMPSVDVINTDYEEIDKIFSTTHKTFPDKIGFGDSAVLEIISTVLPGTNCVATSIEVVPRIDDRGRSIVDVKGEKVISVCPGEEEKTHFVINARGDLSSGFQYYNLADIYTFLGEKVTVNLSVSPMDNRQSTLDLILDSPSILKGGTIEYRVITDGEYELFSDIGFTDEEIIASKTGDHYLIAATDTGEVVKKDFRVKRVLSYIVKNIEKPTTSLDCGEEFNMSFDLQNLGDTKVFKIEILTTYDLDKIDSIHATLNENERKTITLHSRVDENCTGEDQMISIILKDEIVYEKIDIEKTNPFDFFNSVLEAFVAFFEAIGTGVMSLFGG
ncbi:MAG: transglutaminase-like domain-containing protein [Nanoarchaeota archaeon]|nr:transglutaminase-like domain-containing protein [Nanoarchaeota archaeon]MBU1135072.1 transglutaminase-like domain-containing protein [Nanoarchaeota archaeon]MBU2519982.1 transglutaminase-like domain-containing protein [Nanoarchaeota archaeon]